MGIVSEGKTLRKSRNACAQKIFFGQFQENFQEQFPLPPNGKFFCSSSKCLVYNILDEKWNGGD